MQGPGRDAGAQGPVRAEPRSLEAALAPRCPRTAPHSQVQPEAGAAAACRGPACDATTTSYSVPGVRAEKLALSTSAATALAPAGAPARYRATW